ncbi:MAG TPA: DUF2802 domain-containing protein [Candidatus Acidoferrales bacterium]|nr:DUF2802 domain-containing protein [Candidatus Acidoferrales bacterium]
MSLVTALGVALFGGTWGAALAWLLLRVAMRRQAQVAESLQRGLADLQGQYWVLRQFLSQFGAAPGISVVSPEASAAASEQRYERAIRMARQGAHATYLMETCGLNQAEAELLVRLHAAAERAKCGTGGAG